MKEGRVFGYSLGAILPALGVSLSWLCCLPFAAGLLGAGFAAAGGALAPLRPYLSGLALLFLGFAFYHAYKPQPACSKETGCTIQKKGFSRKIILWLLAAITIGLITIQEWSSWVIYWML